MTVYGYLFLWLHDDLAARLVWGIRAARSRPRRDQDGTTVVTLGLVAPGDTL